MGTFEFTWPNMYDELQKSGLGALMAFVTDDDPHSPVMKDRYEQLQAETGLPISWLDCKSFERDELDRMQIYTAPTILWVKLNPEWDPGDPGDYMMWTPVMRVAGIVNYRKLQHEVEKVLDATPS